MYLQTSSSGAGTCAMGTGYFVRPSSLKARRMGVVDPYNFERRADTARTSLNSIGASVSESALPRAGRRPLEESSSCRYDFRHQGGPCFNVAREARRAIRHHRSDSVSSGVRKRAGKGGFAEAWLRPEAASPMGFPLLRPPRAAGIRGAHETGTLRVCRSRALSPSAGLAGGSAPDVRLSRAPVGCARHEVPGLESMLPVDGVGKKTVSGDCGHGGKAAAGSAEGCFGTPCGRRGATFAWGVGGQRPWTSAHPVGGTPPHEGARNGRGPARARLRGQVSPTRGRRHSRTSARVTALCRHRTDSRDECLARRLEDQVCTRRGCSGRSRDPSVGGNKHGRMNGRAAT